jgi:uncharacterized protein (DUF58 family)
LLQTAVVLLLSAIAAVRLNSFWVFLFGMALGATVLSLLKRKIFRVRRLREQVASNRFLGLPNDDP